MKSVLKKVIYLNILKQPCKGMKRLTTSYYYITTNENYKNKPKQLGLFFFAGIYKSRRKVICCKLNRD